MKVPVCRTQFGAWLASNIGFKKWTQAEVAKRLHVSRAHVNNHVTGLTAPTYINVVAYCWLFGVNDDPEEIWKLKDEEFA